ncbi:MAG: hypothetical protein IJB29_07090, partial [Mailhella sp.]|nr:hypothetical protein [Mailhella sp.]
PQPADYKSAALPVELRQQQVWELISSSRLLQEEFSFRLSGVPANSKRYLPKCAHFVKRIFAFF